MYVILSDEEEPEPEPEIPSTTTQTPTETKDKKDSKYAVGIRRSPFDSWCVGKQKFNKIPNKHLDSYETRERLKQNLIFK